MRYSQSTCLSVKTTVGCMCLILTMVLCGKVLRCQNLEEATIKKSLGRYVEQSIYISSNLQTLCIKELFYA